VATQIVAAHPGATVVSQKPQESGKQKKVKERAA